MKDLRKDFQYNSKSFKMSKGHNQKFKKRLEEEFGTSTQTDSSIIYKMVAVAIIAVLSTVFITNQNFVTPKDNPQIIEQAKIGLGDVSPDLKTIEDYYLTSIKLELATLETSENHEMIINSYLEELKIINEAYDALELDLNEIGITDEIINAMINNLQIRLELLQNLKQKLNNLNQKQNEKNAVYQI